MYKFSAIYLVNKNHAYFIECLTTDIIYPNLSGPNLVQCTGQGATTYRKYWARIGQVRTTPAEPELQIIGIHVPLKGYISSSDFYYFWHWGGIAPRHPHAKFHRCGFKNVGSQPQHNHNLHRSKFLSF